MASKKSQNSFVVLSKNLEKAPTEEQVKHYFADYFEIDYDTSDRHDLYTEWWLFEFKHDKNLENHRVCATVLAQALYYIHEIKYDDKKLFWNKPIPNHIFLVDKNEAMILETLDWKAFYDDEKYDWTLTASSPDTQLIDDIVGSAKIRTTKLYHISDQAEFNLFSEQINRIKSSQLSLFVFEDKKKISEDNFEEVYAYWKKTIGQNFPTKPRLSAFFLADIQWKVTETSDGHVFFELWELGNPKIKVVTKDYQYFWSIYDRVHDVHTISNILSKSDRLSDETQRRFEGEFFTPVIFAKLALKYLEDVLWPNWYNEYKIWDMAAGTGNLEYYMHDDGYKNLYLSTLKSEDVDYIHKMFHWVTAFQYDYLNDDVDNLFWPENQTSMATWKLPEKLRQDLANPANKWVILINPPFATSTNHWESSKETVSTTKVRQYMTKDGLGNSSQELFAQFLYRIKKEIPNAHLAMFSTTKYINSNAYEELRDKILTWKYKKGFVFSSENFSGTKWKFPVGMLIWDIWTKTKFSENSIQVDVFNQQVEKEGIKEITTTAIEKWLNKWINRSSCTAVFPPLKSSIEQYGDSVRLDKIPQDGIGYMWCAGNDFQQQNYTAFFSAPFGNGNGFGITRENFSDALIVNTVRRLPKHTWLNDRDQFLQPSQELPQDFVDDCVVWSLFANSNQTSAMSDIAYKWQTYQIENQFFPFPADEIRRWECRDTTMMLAARSDRFVASWLATKTLSPLAQAVLDAGRTVYRLYFAHYHEINTPKWKISTWDAGWYQIRNALTEAGLGSDELKALKAVHKAFEDSILPKIYEYGFLRK